MPRTATQVTPKNQKHHVAAALWLLWTSICLHGITVQNSPYSWSHPIFVKRIDLLNFNINNPYETL